MAKSEKDVSLLPKESFQNAIVGRLVKWLVSAGRFIVIFVDLLVMAAFISRFWLDKKRADLSDGIRQQQAILEATQDFEQEFRSFQIRLNSAEQGVLGQPDLLAPLDAVIESSPEEILFLDYSFSNIVDPKTASVTAYVFTEKSLNFFANNLLAKDNIQSVRIGTIEREQGVVGMRVSFLISFNSLVENNKNEST